MKLNSNTVLAILAVLLVAAAAYWYFFTGTGNEPPLTSATPTTVARAQFEAMISELRLVSFPTGVFSDPRFSGLVDLTTPVTPEAGGRPDPFAAF